MKRTSLLIWCCFCLLTLGAQVEKKYGVGAVPTVNGRVLFEETLTTQKSPSEAYVLAKGWMEKRFVKPTVLAAKITEADDTNQHLVLNAEEYIVFKNLPLVLDRSRINYWLEIECKEGSCTFRMTRIRYWYEEERNGGEKFSAEEWITDQEAFNKSQTKLLKRTGKFRTKTIDLKDQLVSELKVLLQ